MKKRKIVASLFLIIGVLLSVAFLLKIEFPQGFETYFNSEYYTHFGPVVISVELILASYYLLIGHKNTNFTLALFGFTALLDPLFHLTGLSPSLVPLYGTIILSICALVCLWFACTNTFSLNRLSHLAILLSVVMGVFVKLFFN